MADPIITGYTPGLSQPGAPRSFIVKGLYFDLATTYFTLLDVTPLPNPNPTLQEDPIWTPASSLAKSVSTDRKTAVVNSTPSMPHGGSLPSSGDLRISVGNGLITPTKSSLTQNYVYTGNFEIKPRNFPVIVDFSPVCFTYGERATLLITGLEFDDDTSVDIQEVYVRGAEWQVCKTIVVDETILVVVADLVNSIEPFEGPGYLSVTVTGRHPSIQSNLTKPVTYHAADLSLPSGPDQVPVATDSTGASSG